jgi:hypothetical protein
MLAAIQHSPGAWLEVHQAPNHHHHLVSHSFGHPPPPRTATAHCMRAGLYHVPAVVWKASQGPGNHSSCTSLTARLSACVQSSSTGACSCSVYTNNPITIHPLVTHGFTHPLCTCSPGFGTRGSSPCSARGTSAGLTPAGLPAQMGTVK